ncbi:CCA tRNA nucleotidyltransferase [Deltaproteobacteria bacterium PRO3]|nr:CCA tRNA nucleotidyltransferase [Deltaproteobacteria bacterium PRO3]
MSMSFIDAIYQAGGRVYEVGGTVRDELMGHPHKDKDLLVAGVPFEALVRLLGSFGQVHEVGKSFGVLKFKPRGSDHDFDVALPRTEKSTGPHHRDFEVRFDEKLPVELDLQRRDFTINAMAREMKTGELLDPFGGQKDLKAKILRQVFADSFVEDPLRLLRAVQFAARFELSIEPETLIAMKRHAAKIETVSPERVIEEVGKLFRAERPSTGFYLMRDTGLLRYVFPELEKTIGVEQPAKKSGDVFDHTMKVLDASRTCADLDRPGDLEIMFASLFHDIGKPYTVGFNEKTRRITFYGHQIVSTRLARKWMKKYRANMLGIDTENVLSMVHNHMFETKSFYTERAIRRFIHKIGKDLIFKLVDLRIADKKGGAYPNQLKGILRLKRRIQEELDKKPPFGPKDLAIGGHDLMGLGYPEGPILGRILKELVELVLDDPELNTRQSLLEYVLAKYPPAEAAKENHDPRQKKGPEKSPQA